MVLIFVSFNIFSQNIELLTRQLEASTKMVERLSDENKVLSNKSKELKNLLKQAIDALEENNNLIIDMKKGIEKDQEEIKRIRTVLSKSLEGLQNFKYIEVGAGITYPLGGELYFSVNIPILPIGIYTTFGINKFENQAIYGGSVGVKLRL